MYFFAFHELNKRAFSSILLSYHIAKEAYPLKSFKISTLLECDFNNEILYNITE